MVDAAVVDDDVDDGGSEVDDVVDGDFTLVEVGGVVGGAVGIVVTAAVDWQLVAVSTVTSDTARSRRQ